MSDNNKAEDAKPESEETGAISLQQLSIPALKKRIAETQALLNTKIEEEKRRLQSNFEREAAKLDLSPRVEWSAPAALQPGARLEQKGKPLKKGRGDKVPPECKDPNTGNMWSGRGRPQKWIIDLKKEGRNLEDFRI